MLGISIRLWRVLQQQLRKFNLSDALHKWCYERRQSVLVTLEHTILLPVERSSGAFTTASGDACHEHVEQPQLCA